MMMKISLERLLVESSMLQDHRQQGCVIRNGTVESVRRDRQHWGQPEQKP